MSNKGLIIPERSRDIGDFIVGRLLPFRKKRMIGPFIFIDHMGPETLGPGKYMDIGQHPHIGLSTLTYLFEGEIEHRDSLGTRQRVCPGDVNWMTAGKGITHTERTPEEFRDGRSFGMHGYQIWVALPEEMEEMEPQFYHAQSSALPQWNEKGVSFTLIAGQAFGKTSPVPVFSELFLVELKADEQTRIELSGQLKGELGILVVHGTITAGEEVLGGGNILYSKVHEQCSITLGSGSHILVFGGAPFPEGRHIAWNFVSSNPDRIERAKEDWKSKDFPMMPDEDSYIPLPGS